MINTIKKVCVIALFLIPNLLLSGEGNTSYLEGFYKNDLIDISIQLRHRFEARDNFDFNSLNPDAELFHLLRTRINFEFSTSDFFRAFIQLQDSRLFEFESDEPSKRAPFEDELDLRQGYILIKKSPFSLKIGRQELSYGDERLIGGFNWSNIARSFDAVKGGFFSEKLNIDLFFARVVKIENKKFNKWNEEDNFYGIYTISNHIDFAEINTCYFYREILGENMLGLRIKSKKGNLSYLLESAYQFGGKESYSISAYALVFILGYKFNLPFSPYFEIEFDYGSGDDDPNDSTLKTFDNLYPTNHKFYGYMDRASLKNLRNIKFRFSFKPFEKLFIQTDVHFLGINESLDALYAANQKPIRISKASEVSKDVGIELDFISIFSLNENLKFLLGFSHFYPGNYLKETGSADSGEFFYFQTILSF